MIENKKNTVGRITKNMIMNFESKLNVELHNQMNYLSMYNGEADVYLHSRIRRHWHR